MVKLKKLVICFTVLMLLLISFAGCANKAPKESNAGTTSSAANNEKTDGTTQPKENVKISMTWWGDTKRNEVYNHVIDLFEAANPNVKVDRPFSTWADYFNKLSTEIAGGNAPDVIGMHQRYVSEYALRGALHDLQPFINSGALDVSNIPKSVLDSGYVKGTLYMIPQGITGSGVAYNTSTFDKLGVSYPNMDWTWDDFAQKLKEIKTAAKQKGIDIWPSADLSTDIYNFSYWARANGYHLFTEDGKIGFTEDIAASWFKFWKDLRDQGLIPDASTTTEYNGLPLEQSLFATNKVAISGMPASQIYLYQQQVTDNGQINIVRFPHINGKPDPEYISGAFFTVYAKSKNPEVAAKLIDFFVNNTEAQKVFKLEQGVPPATTAVQAISGSLSDAEKKSLDFIENQLIKHASPEPYPPTGYNEISTDFTNIATAVAFGKQTPEEGAAQLMKDAEKILSSK